MLSEASGAVTVARSAEHGTLAMCSWRPVLTFVGWNLLCEDRMPLLVFTRKTLVLEVSTHCGVAVV